jgi:hypothetical protein
MQAAAPQALGWVVAVDGVHVRPTGNVSEAYNAFFAAVPALGGVVVVAGAPVPLTRGGVVVFEPGLWAPAALAALVADPGLMFAVAYVDDVTAALRGLAAVAVGGVLHGVATAVAGPYVNYLQTLAVSAHLQGVPPLHPVPHAVAPVWVSGGPPCHHRLPTCVVWGQRGEDAYPGRAAVAAAADGRVIRALPPPGYAPGAALRTDPAVVAACLRAATACYAGGDALGVLTAKHMEAAACGCCVLTSSTDAVSEGAALGLTLHYVEPTGPAVRAAVAALRPGAAEAANMRVCATVLTPVACVARVAALANPPAFTASRGLH